MGKIDGNRYPQRMDAEDAVEVAKAAVNEFEGEPPNKEVFAEALGHSTANSGAYIKRVADARSYGLLPKQGLEATELAHRVANPKDEKELHEGMFEMYQNIPILEELYENLDGREPPNKLWSVLSEITEASRTEAKDAEEDIKRLYNDMVGVAAKKADTSSKPQSDRTQVPTESQSGGVNETGNPASDSDIYLKVGSDEHKFEELTAINIEIAQKILESKKPAKSTGKKGNKDESQDADTESHATFDEFN
ncbi:hypothetical protein [Haloarcula montana]|uniref:hypothetical protein n=1 Tax=Haloarcula montana TaxID=3111776 RepID=UPI002D778859|nr:hypothetical protein [Haloarcula sp. GH36]